MEMEVFYPSKHRKRQKRNKDNNKPANRDTNIYIFLEKVMLGTFMNALEGTGDMTVSKVPFDKLQSMAAGAPVVAVQNIRDLQQFGLSSGIHFGIASHNAKVIFQECRCNDMLTCKT